MTQLKRRNGTVICEAEGTLRDVVLEAYKKGLDLRGADLGGADLGDAYLGDADLGGADLRDADLGGAYLGGAYLGGAYLGGAYLGGTYLRGAYLRGADLGGADLGGAYLRGAYLGGADLGGADLGGADLRDAYLRGADLGGADLRGVKLNWSSHDILAHILVSSAGNDLQRRMLAGLVLVSRDWCWEQFAALDLPETLVRWAVEALAPWAEFSAPPELFVELAQRLAIALPTSEVTTDGRNEDRVV